MHLDQILLQIGQTPFTLLDLMVVGAVFALLLLLAAVIFAWRAQAQRRGEAFDALRRASEMEIRLAEMSGHLRSFAEQSQGSQLQLTRTLD